MEAQLESAVNIQPNLPRINQYSWLSLLQKKERNTYAVWVIGCRNVVTLRFILTRDHLNDKEFRIASTVTHNGIIIFIIITRFCVDWKGLIVAEQLAPLGSNPDWCFLCGCVCVCCLCLWSESQPTTPFVLYIYVYFNSKPHDTSGHFAGEWPHVTWSTCKCIQIYFNPFMQKDNKSMKDFLWKKWRCEKTVANEGLDYCYLLKYTLSLKIWGEIKYSCYCTYPVKLCVWVQQLWLINMQTIFSVCCA